MADAAGTPPFRLGLVGAGRMGRKHREALAQSSVVSVTAVVEPRQEARAEAQADGLEVFESVEALVTQGSVDGALVAAPTPLHGAVIEELAAAGVPVLCEKPCGMTSSDAAAAVGCAQDAGIPLQIAYWHRFVPELAALRKRMQDGELGTVLSVHSVQWDESPPAEAFRAQSGGIFIDMGVHEFDQVRWLTGQDIVEVRSVACGSTAGYRTPVDADCAEAVATLSDGACALVSVGRWHEGGDSCSVDVFGTRRSVSIRFVEGPGGDAVIVAALREQAEDFARHVRGETSHGATATDAVAALAAAEQATAAMNVAGVHGTGAR